MKRDVSRALWSFCACLLLSARLAQPASPLQATSAGFTVEDLLNVVNVGVADLSPDGRWLAVTASTLRDRIGIDNSRFGDPTYVAPAFSEVWVIDTRSSRIQKPFSDRRQVRGMRWSPDGARLALLVLDGKEFAPRIWHRDGGKIEDVKLPAGQHVAENAELIWTEDGGRVILPLHTEEQQRAWRERFEQETRGPIVVLSSKDPFLSWEELRRAPFQRSLAAYDLAAGRIQQIFPTSPLNSYDLTETGSLLTYQTDITKKTDYDVIGGRDTRLQTVPLAGGETRTVLTSTKGLSLQWSREGKHFAYAKEGNVFFGSIEAGEPRQLTGEKSGKKETEKSVAEKDEDKDKDAKAKERFSVVRVSPRGRLLVASNKEGLWILEAESGTKELFLKSPEEDKEAPRYQVVEWSPDESTIYLSYSSRTKWERGLFQYDTGRKELRELFKDDRLYGGFRLSRDGGTLVFSAAQGNRPSDLYASDAAGGNLRRLTNSNPNLRDEQLSKSELVSYYDADGNKLHGVLYYPLGYEPGKRYPTVFNVYEQFFDDRFSGTLNLLAANGYAVMQPSVTLETGYPGEAWVKGVTAAANKLIDMGIADPERLGVQGTSYGGYATNLLITQTQRFRAAINISGKVNMVSFYTDSPRLGVRNIHAPEKSQDRIGATLWQQPQKYIQHSAIMFADRIKTPLLLMTGEQDHNVPARQAMEMYYALRRLGREVVWVNYVNGGHGMPTSTVEEVRDYHERIIRWYDDHLKGDLKKKEATENPQP